MIALAIACSVGVGAMAALILGALLIQHAHECDARDHASRSQDDGPE